MLARPASHAQVLRLSVPVFLALAAAGCSTLDSLNPLSDKTTPDCPAIALLEETASAPKLLSTAGTPDSVVMTATLGRPAMECVYTPAGNVDQVTIHIPLKVVPGPAAGKAAVATRTVVYFITELDASGTIIGKKLYSLDLPVTAQSLTLEPPVMNVGVASGKTPAQYQLLVGFQLAPGELAYVRSQK